MEREALYVLADRCRAADRRKTPERVWLGQQCEAYYKRSGAGKKADGDASLYTRVFGRLPKTPSDTLKIRYWRTGYTTPSNREILLALGRALEFDEVQMQYLIQYYYDRNDRIFTEADRQNSLYLERIALLRELKEEFLVKLPPIYLRSLGIRRTEAEHYFRHLFYLESLAYTAHAPQAPVFPMGTNSGSHLVSVSYASTLRDMMELQGEIPRKNMIRLLVLLMSPFLSRRRLSDNLQRLGFAPLDPAHHLPGGGRLDAMLLGLLDAYEEECRGQDPESCRLWLKHTLREIDRYLADTKADDLRFLHYKAIARGGSST